MTFKSKYGDILELLLLYEFASDAEFEIFGIPENKRRRIMRYAIEIIHKKY